jgi:uncharacterized protein
VRDHRVAIWRGLDAWRAEYADVWLHADRLLARGTQLGVEPESYRLQYALDTAPGFRTARLTADTAGAGWSRRVDLICDADGTWHVSGDGAGDAELPAAGGDAAALAGAVDCDVGFSALFNSLPILRERLLEHGKPMDFEMAWVSVPDLAVNKAPQRYVPLSDERVQFISSEGAFRAEIHFDDEGLVTLYEDFLERVA